MDQKRSGFFWPSYVDLLTALFAVVLVLFVLSFYNFNRSKKELENLVKIKEHEAAILNKVRANFKIFETDSTLFNYDTVYNRIELRMGIKFRTGKEYYHIRELDIEGNFGEAKMKVDSIGHKFKLIIDAFKKQKYSDTTMKDISYLMVISGSASNLPGNDESTNYTLSYNRALFLYKYWKDSLGIDFDSPGYHDIIELQISGMGFGGIGRYNFPYNEGNTNEEKKNQRFIISIAPKIGK